MDLFDIPTLIKTIGLIGIFIFVFAESGLFFGFFLPGDTLLFTAGVLAAAGYFNIAYLLIGAFLCAVLGDTFGYWFGKKVGPKIFNKPKSIFFSKHNLEKTARFFDKHGNKAITLARFVPIVRTFIPILAGVGKMNYKIFLTWNILGGMLWTGLMVFLGYFLGSSIKNIDRFILPIIIFIILVSLIPFLIQLTRRAEEKRDETSKKSFPEV